MQCAQAHACTLQGCCAGAHRHSRAGQRHSLSPALLHYTARAKCEQVRECAGVPCERKCGGGGNDGSPGQLASDGGRHSDAVGWHARRASPGQAHGHQPAHRRAGARLRVAACASPRSAPPLCLIMAAMD